MVKSEVRASLLLNPEPEGRGFINGKLAIAKDKVVCLLYTP